MMTFLSPYYEAGQAARYQRQELIREYQREYACRLVVMQDTLFPESVGLFEETLFDANPDEDLHLILVTEGGDGETALRLTRQAQSWCRELTVIVPDQAKSAGTLLALGAHHIHMGPTSDLGPLDPQFQLSDGSLASARAIIASVEHAETQVQKNPDTYPIHAVLLEPVTALIVQQARDQLARTGDLVKAALACVPDRSQHAVEHLAKALKKPLIDDPRSHSAVVSAADARKLGLPVVETPPGGAQWRAIWRLWMRYAVLDAPRIYEGQNASHVETRK